MHEAAAAALLLMMYSAAQRRRRTRARAPSRRRRHARWPSAAPTLSLALGIPRSTWRCAHAAAPRATPRAHSARTCRVFPPVAQNRDGRQSLLLVAAGGAVDSSGTPAALAAQCAGYALLAVAVVGEPAPRGRARRLPRASPRHAGGAAVRRVRHAQRAGNGRRRGPGALAAAGSWQWLRRAVRARAVENVPGRRGARRA